MEAVLQWGLDCIRLVQSWASPPLTVFMKMITALGSITVYLVLLPFLFWCIDEKKSLRLGIAVLVSLWVNLVLKFLLDQPRPFFAGYDPSVGMIPERLGGFPSGHAQTTLVMWIIIASWGKKKWHYAAAAVLCLLVGFSRVYLGVHFPTDVFGGWLLAALILCGYFLAGGRIEALLAAGGHRAGMIASAALSFAMILYRPSTALLMPAGMILGLGAGYVLNRRHIGFAASELAGKTGAAKYLALLVRFALGIAAMILLYMLTGKLAALSDTIGSNDLFIFIRFALLALWVSAGAPWLFRVMRKSN
ncbi:MAG: phosphatase PAP2 family protein [Treponema sp.]|nr:phosphatase PAP2 family protein [Treponema sp.]